MFQTCNDLVSLRNVLADQIHSNAKWPEVKEILDEALERAAYLGVCLFKESLMQIEDIQIISVKEVNELEFPPV